MSKANYTQKKITSNYTVIHDGFSCISFTNKGDSEVLLNGTYILSSGESITFNEDKGIVINNDFNITFREDLNNEVVIIKCYYHD